MKGSEFDMEAIYVALLIYLPDKYKFSKNVPEPCKAGVSEKLTALGMAYLLED